MQHLMNQIKLAIAEHRLITFVYVKRQGETFYPRQIEPYCLYIAPTGNILIDGYQWSGDSDSKKQWVWKRFDITKIAGLEITDRTVKRDHAKDYNPTSDRYRNALVKR